MSTNRVFRRLGIRTGTSLGLLTDCNPYSSTQGTHRDHNARGDGYKLRGDRQLSRSKQNYERYSEPSTHQYRVTPDRVSRMRVGRRHAGKEGCENHEREKSHPADTFRLGTIETGDCASRKSCEEGDCEVQPYKKGVGFIQDIDLKSQSISPTIILI